MLSLFAVLSIFLTSLIGLRVWRAAKLKTLLRLPPGPKPLPIIGNILDAPRKHLGREIAALSDQYGDLVYLEVFGQPMLLLGSYEVAQELLDKRSSKYSGRAKSTMVDLTGLDCMFPTKQYGHEWRRDRRAFHQAFNPEAISHYHPIHLKVTRNLLRSILASPKDLSKHLKFSFAAAIMRVAYGIELTEHNDQYYAMVNQVMGVAESITVPGRYLVDVIPILRHLPSWLPGVTFKRYAANAKRDVVSVINTLFDKAVHNAGGEGDSMIAKLLSIPGDCDSAAFKAQMAEKQEMCKGLAAVTYVAGADTTYTALQAFFLALAMHPESQAKAQAELDSVVGADRLPDFSDRNDLPYINALLKEVQRWHVITPIGMPHRTTTDDEYNGYYIPAGTTVAANAWAMARDVNRFPNPDMFCPERFLDVNGKLDLKTGDPANFLFGFGRRICPGRHFADAELFITCAAILHVFNIGPPLDEDGRPKKLEHKMTTHLAISETEPYDYTIWPRSAQANRLILETSNVV